MRLLFTVLCISYCSVLADPQEDEGLSREMQDFVRKLTQQMHTTQNWHGYPAGYSNSPQDGGRAAAARSFASSLSGPLKRPYGQEEETDSQALAIASVKDVNEAEHMGDDMASAAGKSRSISTSNGMLGSSSSAKASSMSSSSSSAGTGPYAMKQQQPADNVVRKEEESFSDVYFVAIVAGCCAAGIFGIVSAGFCFYRLQKSRKAAADVDYPAYGVTGPCKDVTSPSGDRKLAQSAQMYHYQHQKQQMIAVEKAGSTKNTSASDVDSEEENEEGDYTVYECPGLAPSGEMEVKNPLFHDDSTPVSPPTAPAKSDSIQE